MADKFEAWCIVEIMGHTRASGRVTEETIAGVPMLRIDQPTSRTDLTAFRTTYQPGTSIFRIHPCDEDTARLAAAADAKRESYEYDIDQYLARVNERGQEKRLTSQRNRDDMFYDAGDEG